MAYASVNVFTVTPGAIDQFTTLNREQFLPLLNRQDGFVAFELVQTGADSGVAILWWQSEQARIDATPRLTPWVDEHLERFLVRLENPAGDVVLSSRTDR
jgi:Antibiotic biosynthesis monooxygenase